MEGTTSLATAKKIMADNFIGPDELRLINASFSLKIPGDTGAILPIPFSEELLTKAKNEYLLILGVPLLNNGQKVTLVSLRNIFGTDPAVKEPCFYNQDWYLNEPFALETTPLFKWYLIDKKIEEDTRGRELNTIVSSLNSKESLPAAVITAYCFFAFYFHSAGKMLWRDDFLWCSDTDTNGDPIYTGRYIDNKGLNKNGFNIHRHLRIKSNYGASKVLTEGDKTSLSF